jgi:hypothetical protein
LKTSEAAARSTPFCTMHKLTNCKSIFFVALEETPFSPFIFLGQFSASREFQGPAKEIYGELESKSSATFALERPQNSSLISL